MSLCDIEKLDVFGSALDTHAMSIETTEVKNDLSDAVAAEIRAWMGRLSIRQSQLARHLGENEQWLSTRLRGLTPLSMNDAGRIARALGLRAVDLLPQREREVTVTQRQSRQAYVGHGYNARPDRGGPPPGPRRTALIPHQTHRVTSP